MRGQRSGKSMRLCYNIFALCELGKWNLMLTQNLNTSTHHTRNTIYKPTTINTETMQNIGVISEKYNVHIIFTFTKGMQ